MDDPINSVSRISFLGDNQFSEFIREVLPGDPSQHAIVILISYFLKSEGASRVAEFQARELSKRGYSVIVYTFESDIDPIGYNVRIIDSWVQKYASRLNVLYRALFPFNLWKALKISLDLKKSSLIIVHQETLVIVAYFAKLFYHTQVIYWHHHIAESRFLPLKVRLYKVAISPFNWKKIKKFDQVVSISNHSKAILQHEKGIESIVIYDEIDSSRFNRNNVDEEPIRTKYHIGSDDPVILFVGRIVPTKNIHSLIVAFKIVKICLPNVKLIVVGKSYDNQYSEDLARACDLSVIFAGFVSDEELPYYYAACDVYATCSLVEGFNMPLVEAQACGKPVVAFDIGPHREVIKNGFLVDEGDIVEFGNAIIKIFSTNMIP
ncbi:glycosyltransferase family 4 protein [Methanofollis ethanolicus]|uniref:glycosyltransferase family 4 protein n=1 Tax=Methanofollis ethanolicus TaxID=488124 RepID=UPI0009FB892C|nr:glycosyltransferase family 4 protein [Methanofollis ethanolicus]